MADVGEVSGDGWGVAQSSPGRRCPVEHSPYESEAGCFAGEPADDFHTSSGFAEGPFDEVGVSDPFVVLGRES